MPKLKEKFKGELELLKHCGDNVVVQKTLVVAAGYRKEIKGV